MTKSVFSQHHQGYVQQMPLTIHDVSVVDVLGDERRQKALEPLSDIGLHISMHRRLSQHVHVLVHLGTQVGSGTGSQEGEGGVGGGGKINFTLHSSGNLQSHFTLIWKSSVSQIFILTPFNFLRVYPSRKLQLKVS